MAQTQAERNPYPYSDTNKRYYTYEYYLRQTFGGKCAKLPLDIGLSCPNIDGRCATGGCIYCSGRGSGDFAPDSILSVAEQIRAQKELFSHKWDVSRCIAYFQAHTNTYAPVDFLRARFYEALAADGIVGINIATRADCLPHDVLALLAELAEQTVLTVELGLQTSNDETARRINRGHTFAQFLQGYQALKSASDRIGICAHIIFGLPGESDADMLQTVCDVAALRPQQVKIHLLHVLRGTPLATVYERGDYVPLERERYIRLVADALELLPPDTVIGRLTGDGKGEDLLAPDWSRKKTTVINDIDKLLYARDSYQGKSFSPQEKANLL
ncbi:MAG: TIGR01212 family radical SAM protein [Clostridia bacterium]|nr:TIGR01212 family radical SAM protein [Clostridia bacterium]MBQ9774366.1 TIGR01212 family radical SAM protein [Clostridia bacterium]